MLTKRVLKPLAFTLSINAASSGSDKAWINPHADISLIRKGLFLLSVRYFLVALNLSGKVADDCALAVNPVCSDNRISMKVIFRL